MERSAELEELVVAWFKAASRGDASAVDEHVSFHEGARLIGSDPQEWFRGGNAIAEFLRGEVRGAGGSVLFTPLEIEAFSEGTVGWAATRLKITMPDGRHVSPRWSAVFHQENGTWKFVQTHASVAVPNDQIGWTYDK
jgi:ketosteroid isomerase-like protein